MEHFKSLIRLIYEQKNKLMRAVKIPGARWEVVLESDLMSEDGTARSEQSSQMELVVIKRPEPENMQNLGQNLKSEPINKQAGCPKISRDHRGLFIYKGQVGVKGGGQRWSDFSKQ